jgi:hypothetical protein
MGLRAKAKAPSRYASEGADLRLRPVTNPTCARAKWRRNETPVGSHRHVSHYMVSARKADNQAEAMPDAGADCDEISVRSMQRAKRAVKLAGEEAVKEIKARPGITMAAIEREAIYVWIRQQGDAATSDEDKRYFEALETALRFKHGGQRNKVERMKQIWRNANEDQHQEFIDWLHCGCRDDDDCDDDEAA